MPDVTIDTSSPVLVTGATGYLAGWIICRLLEAGATVHATVRDPDDQTKLAHLNAKAENSLGAIRFFKADLLQNKSFSGAMQGCKTVLHTAFPVAESGKGPEEGLIEPALSGTRNVLEEAGRIESVRRVVMTGSCAAIVTDAADCAVEPGGVLTEEVWNKTASLHYRPYALCRTLVEQEAWRISADVGVNLVTINPCLMLGPAAGPKPASESFKIVDRAVSGEFFDGAPRLGMGFVDVRDVAQAHLAAAFLPEAQGRYIVCGHCTDLLTALKCLQPKFGADHRLPKRAIPKYILWLLAPRLGFQRRFVQRNINVAWKADNRKSREQLGLSYRPLQETMEEMFEYIVAQRKHRSPEISQR